jgi:hypothetical protein
VNNASIHIPLLTELVEVVKSVGAINIVPLTGQEPGQPSAHRVQPQTIEIEETPLGGTYMLLSPRNRHHPKPDAVLAIV